jgi:Cupin-like domain
VKPSLPPRPPQPRPAPNARRGSAASPGLFGPSQAKSRLDGLASLPHQELDDRWYQWIADNRLRDCTPDSMLATMTTAGLDPGEARSAIALMDRSPGIVAARKFQQIQRKLESMMTNQQKLRELAAGYQRVEKRSGVSRDEFLERYAIGSRPVVLTDAAHDWPALQRWSPHYLRERFGDLEVEVQAERNADPKFEQNKQQHRRTMRLGEFVDRVLAGGATNDYYLTANNEILRRPEFAPLLADIGTLPDFCRQDDLARSINFWFGPAGTNTPLHHDTLMLLHTQVVGRKRWRFISPLDTPRVYNYSGVFSPIDIDHPDLARYPLFGGVKVLDVVVEPGETIFLPLAWWHQVAGLDVSLSVSYTNIDLPNDWQFVDPHVDDW